MEMLSSFGPELHIAFSVIDKGVYFLRVHIIDCMQAEKKSGRPEGYMYKIWIAVLEANKSSAVPQISS